ncbi:SseB family protein [Streptantibioticus ferralitis]|uniref:SseB family protein n=1 Tax=Streptantibioticus ferralitis TaxID=236510 RepID=A0ABT5Z6X8_9ACTN|nr:SseB family protein [Streptantibioticus ferralitis]MDF2259581.1 SseB family protein [Streptantibioticus ferralitis]
MALKNIPDPGFSDDDGTADPRLAAALAAYADDRAAEPDVLAALVGARLLVPVVALLGEVETDAEGAADGAAARSASVEGGGGRRAGGLRREKTSDMAVPTIQAPGGRKALPAFSSVESLARWRADARPVAVPLPQALQALAHEQADTLLIDMAGPVPYALSGPALHALASGRDRLDPLTDPLVADAVRNVVAAEPEVVRAHLVPSAETDGTVGLVLGAGAQVSVVAQRVATALAADAALRTRLVRGLELALLPPEAAVPGEPLFVR